MLARKYIPVGSRFSRLVVISEIEKAKTRTGKVFYGPRCRCDCGNELHVTNCNLANGHTRSCGCLYREEARARFSKHGKRYTRTYRIWQAMLTRCGNKNHLQFKDYGGRGLLVCEGLKTFIGFFAVLGECPPRLEIDRWPNNKTGYYSCGKCNECLKHGWPLNVRWATRKQQGRNKRSNKIYTVQGITACLTELCERLGLSYGMVQSRLQYGWSVEKAFLHPPRIWPSQVKK